MAHCSNAGDNVRSRGIDRDASASVCRKKERLPLKEMIFEIGIFTNKLNLVQ